MRAWASQPANICSPGIQTHKHFHTSCLMETTSEVWEEIVLTNHKKQAQRGWVTALRHSARTLQGQSSNLPFQTQLFCSLPSFIGTPITLITLEKHPQIKYTPGLAELTAVQSKEMYQATTRKLIMQQALGGAVHKHFLRTTR